MENHGEQIKKVGIAILVIGIVSRIVVFITGLVSGNSMLLGLSVGLALSCYFLSIITRGFGELVDSAVDSLSVIRNIYFILNDNKMYTQVNESIKSVVNDNSGNLFCEDNTDYDKRLKMISLNSGISIDDKVKLKELAKMASESDFRKEFLKAIKKS